MQHISETHRPAFKRKESSVRVAILLDLDPRGPGPVRLLADRLQLQQLPAELGIDREDLPIVGLNACAARSILIEQLRFLDELGIDRADPLTVRPDACAVRSR